ncbi:MAG: type II toxin-antitoxin system RelE/ParE family toxin [Oscillospiraceae bacterium]|nr:type II toxin-antitoxin system RelE/ParE family toxin [Oscillospiraceae bacterium]
MGYKLIITKTFNDDLDGIVEYLSEQLFNPNAADRLMKKAEEKISNISGNPFIYPLYHDERFAEKGYRYTVVSNYILLYTVDKEAKNIHIVRLIYGGQNILNII